MPSGADLEYARMLARAGVPAAIAQGYDAARLEQIGDTSEQAPTKSLKELSDRVTNLQVFNVLDYGAVADFSTSNGLTTPNYASLYLGTDNTAAFQAAINAAQAVGGRVHIPAGDYLIANTLNISGPMQLVGTTNTRIFAKIYDKTKSVLRVSGCSRGLIQDLMIFGSGYLPKAGIEFHTADSQACVVRNVFVANCRHGLYCNEGEVINRIVVDTCAFISNLIAGIYIDSLGGTESYAQSGPLTFTHVICNSNGPQTWMNGATYDGLFHRNAEDKYGRQVFVRGFVNLTWLGGQISDHSACELINLAEFKSGNGLSIIGADFEDFRNPVTAAGVPITDPTLDNYAFNESAACVINNVGSVSISQSHTYLINCNSIFKFCYECDNVSVNDVYLSGTAAYVIDSFGNNSETLNFIRIDHNVKPSRVHPRAIANTDRSKMQLLLGIKDGFTPVDGKINAHFDYPYAIDAGMYRINYFGGDWNNPNTANGPYWDRQVYGASHIYYDLTTLLSFQPDGRFYIVAYNDSGAVLGTHNTTLNGLNNYGSKRLRYGRFTLPAVTTRVRFGFLNNGNYYGSIPDHVGIEGLNVYAITDNFNTVVLNQSGNEQHGQGTAVLRNMTYKDAAPTTGTYYKGHIVWNSHPDTGEAVGWVCTAGGTPGTWKSFGTIS